MARGSNPLLAEHPLHRALGDSAAVRQTEYRALFRAALDDGFVEALRHATNGGWALGDERFKRAIAKALGRRVAPLPLRRKAKPRDDKRQISLPLTPILSRSAEHFTVRILPQHVGVRVPVGMPLILWER